MENIIQNSKVCDAPIDLDNGKLSLKAYKPIYIIIKY